MRRNRGAGRGGDGGVEESAAEATAGSIAGEEDEAAAAIECAAAEADCAAGITLTTGSIGALDAAAVAAPAGGIECAADIGGVCVATEGAARIA